ncbi:MAG: hypothetical protein V1875_08435 [Candidatus Altiarchaeota archaeon]
MAALTSLLVRPANSVPATPPFVNRTFGKVLCVSIKNGKVMVDPLTPFMLDGSVKDEPLLKIACLSFRAYPLVFSSKFLFNSYSVIIYAYRYKNLPVFVFCIYSDKSRGD